MASNYTRWYREGTVTVTKNSAAVTGKDTLWQTAGLKAGDMFSIDSVTEYEVDSITDNTHLTLKTNYTGENASNTKYRIIRNWTSVSTAEVAAQASELLTDFAKYIDTDMQTLNGKSAYTVACENGFVGTQSEWLASLDAYGVAQKNGYTGTRAQWLESLKAAGEWADAKKRLTSLESDNTSSKSRILTLENYNSGSRLTSLESKVTTLEGYNASTRLTDLEGRADILEGYDLDTRTKTLESRTINNAYVRNLLFRGANLGTEITDEQWNAIANYGKYGDTTLYLGDRWQPTIDGRVWQIVIGGFHHGKILVIIHTNSVGQWHTSDDIANVGYKNSSIRTVTLKSYQTLIEDWLGNANRLFTIDEYLPDKAPPVYNNGGNGHTYDKLNLLSLRNITGRAFNTGSGVDIWHRTEYWFPYFKLRYSISGGSVDHVTMKDWYYYYRYWTRDTYKYLDGSIKVLCNWGGYVFNGGISFDSAASQEPIICFGYLQKA